MSEAKKGGFLNARLLLAVAFLAVTFGGVLYTKKAHPLREHATVSCQNPVLWPTKHLENENSCPISPDSETITTFWNTENFGGDKELIAGIVIKIHANLIEPAYLGKAQIDSAIVAVDKKTHKVVEKKFSKFSKQYPARFYGHSQASQEMPVLSITMNQDHYYRLEVYDIRAFIVRYDYRFRVDYFKNKKLLINAWFSTSDFTPFSRIRQFQQPEILILILISLYFIYRLLFVDTVKLLDPFAWLVVLNTIAAGIYLWPGPIEGIRPMYAFLIFQLITNMTVDFFIFGKCWFKPLNTLLPFIFFFVNIVMIGFWQVAVRDSFEEPFPLDENFRIDVSREFQGNVMAILKIKFALHVASLIVGSLRGASLTRTFGHLLPVFFGVSAWVTSMEKSENPYMEDEKNPYRIYLDFCFVPLVLLILQYTAIDGNRSYLFLPPADEPVALLRMPPLDKITDLVIAGLSKIPLLGRWFK